MSNVIHEVKRRIQRNQQLNIMVCGAAGIGKSSFVKLFIKKFNLKSAEIVIK